MAKAAKTKSAQGPDLRAFFDFIQTISAEKGLSRDEVLEVVRGSLITAYQKKYGPDVRLEVILDKETPEIAVIIIRTVVDKVQNIALEISLEEAKKTQADAEIGQEHRVKENPFEISRIGATNVRQILLQRLRELEREIIYNEFKQKEGELVNGYFLRWRDKEIVYVDLGKVEGILPRKEQIPNDKFRPNDRVKAIIKQVELRREKSKEPGPFITLSRASGDFVKKLFEMEIPEVYDGVVEILKIVRHAGYRTKIIVQSNQSGVDPVGACVGLKGVRIQSIVRELGGSEKIDIVKYTDIAEDLIREAMSPAEVLEVKVDPAKREALVIVSDKTQNQAIGHGGQNVRLASMLTGYKIFVKSGSQYNEQTPEARARLEEIFSPPREVESVEEVEAESEFTPLADLPGLTPRIIGLLEEAGIHNVEALVEMDADALESLPGLGKSTAKMISKILSEFVEFEEV